MKRFRKLFSFLLCSAYITVSVFGGCRLSAFASNVGTGTVGVSEINGHESYLIPANTVDTSGGGLYFYRTPDGYFNAMPQASVTKNVFAHLGLSIAESLLSSFLNLCDPANILTGALASVFENDGGHICYDDSGLIALGYTFDDISGLQYVGVLTNPSTDLYITNPTSNGFYDLWNSANLVTPDYIFIETITADEALRRYQSFDNSNYIMQSNYVNFLDDGFLHDNFLFDCRINKATSNLFWAVDYWQYCLPYDICLTAAYGYSNFCSSNKLFHSGDSVSLSDVSGNLELYFYAYDGDSFSSRLTSVSMISALSNSPFYQTKDNYDISERVVYYGIVKNDMFNYFIISENGGYYPVFKSLSLYSQFKAGTYQPSVVTTDSYNNYSTTNDNSVTYTKTASENISNNYNQVYENTVSEYYNYVNEDNSTTTINNYYGIDQEGLQELLQTYINAVNGSNDSGGDSGGDSGNSSSGIWDRLADGIANLLSVIGKILGGIITGIIELITQILSVFTDIPALFSGFTDFLQVLFSWMPEELVSVIVAAFGIFILVALIKFIRG